MRLLNFIGIIMVVFFAAGCKEKEIDPAPPKTMVNWVTELIQNTPPERNVYISNPSVVTWKNEAGAGEYTCSTDCSGLITALIRVTYKYNSTDFQTWIGSSRPSAAEYHQAIEQKNRFSRYYYISDIQPDMIIALKYPDSIAITGHVMLVTSKPEEITPIAPISGSTRQWVVRIADSSRSPHTNDSRCDTCSGLGAGNIRLYTDANGVVIGHTWSLSSGSTMYSGSQRPITIGKFIP